MNFSNYVFVKGFHSHHFYFGTVALFCGGVLGILSVSVRKLKVASALIGVVTGLFTDEVGLLLNCTSASKQCSYAFPDTPDIIRTITIVIIFLIALVDSNNFVLKSSFLNQKKQK